MAVIDITAIKLRFISKRLTEIAPLSFSSQIIQTLASGREQKVGLVPSRWSQKERRNPSLRIRLILLGNFQAVEPERSSNASAKVLTNEQMKEDKL